VETVAISFDNGDFLAGDFVASASCSKWMMGATSASFSESLAVAAFLGAATEDSGGVAVEVFPEGVEEKGGRVDLADPFGAAAAFAAAASLAAAAFAAATSLAAAVGVWCPEEHRYPRETQRGVEHRG
jgi:hypothetical protein